MAETSQGPDPYGKSRACTAEEGLSAEGNTDSNAQTSKAKTRGYGSLVNFLSLDVSSVCKNLNAVEQTQEKDTSP